MDKVINYAKQELEKYLEILGVSAEIELHLFEELGLKAGEGISEEKYFW